MPWQENSTMSLRLEFVLLAAHETTNMRELCRRYQISAKTGYKWLQRYRAGGESGLTDQSRRPQTSPGRTPEALEAAVLTVRAAHPTWGGRKIKAFLERAGSWPAVPAASTLTAILRRHGCIDAQEAQKHKAFQRFEAAAPNSLWQMDFKGHFALDNGHRCHPLTVLDDHSRFLLGLQACGNETGPTVQQQLTTLFRHYGLPERLLCDNGSPWGAAGGHPYTPLTAWLMRLGIRPVHGRPYHPQTQGKDERVHRTLKDELLRHHTFSDLALCQQAFDAWRQAYNWQRPHEALALAVPADRYHPSPRSFPEVLPPILYPPADPVRKVQAKGEISFQGQVFPIGKAFTGYPVALRTTATATFDVYFCDFRITQIALHRDTLPDDSAAEEA